MKGRACGCWDEVSALPHDGSVTLLDVRTEEEYQRGHLDGFRNIPLDDLREHFRRVRPGQACLCELPDRASQLSGLSTFDTARLHLYPSLRRIQLLSSHHSRTSDSAERLSLRNGARMNEKLNRQRSVFPSDKALLKSLCLSTLQATKKWTQPLRNLKA